MAKLPSSVSTIHIGAIFTSKTDAEIKASFAKVETPLIHVLVEPNLLLKSPDRLLVVEIDEKGRSVEQNDCVQGVGEHGSTPRCVELVSFESHVKLVAEDVRLLQLRGHIVNLCCHR